MSDRTAIEIAGDIDPQRITEIVDKLELIVLAAQARDQAYAPYSNYAVGAALLGKSGRIYTGCNVENAVYSLTVCAERTALFKAVSEGERQFDALAVVTANGGSPCGSCRQVLAEFGPDLRVLIAVPGKLVSVQTIAELLPRAFGPRDLADSTTT
jgi:cytidine deaminase